MGTSGQLRRDGVGVQRFYGPVGLPSIFSVGSRQADVYGAVRRQPVGQKQGVSMRGTIGGVGPVGLVVLGEGVVDPGGISQQLQPLARERLSTGGLFGRRFRGQ